LKTQGTDLYAIDPDTGELIIVGCPTSIDGIDTSIEQLETTCLNSLARTYEAGLATPGTATFGINVDPKDPSHVRLHQLKVAGRDMHWAVGWSEAPGVPPTITTNSDGEYEFVPAPARSWLFFDGFMNSFPFTFALNAQVASTVGIQVSGEPELVPMAS
jgi:tail tube protein